VISGAVVSAGVTMTSLVVVPTFPAASTLMYVSVYVPGTSGLTVPVTVTLPPSSEEAPGSVKESPSDIVIGLSPFIMITGAMLSVAVTMTSLVVVPTFPASSTLMYVSVYVPGTSGLTVPVTVTLPPSSEEAPGSVKDSPSDIVIGLSPFTVITGAVLSGTVTITSLVVVATFPASSTAVYVSVYVPGTSGLTVPVTVTVWPPSAEASGAVKESP